MMNDILIKWGSEVRSLSLHVHIKERPYEDTRRRPSENQEEDSQQTSNLLVSFILDSTASLEESWTLLKLWEISVCCLSHSGCGILSQKLGLGGSFSFSQSSQKGLRGCYLGGREDEPYLSFCIENWSPRRIRFSSDSISAERTG